jgi:hypothetical protein
LTIAGQTYTVTQGGAAADTTPPSATLTSPSSGSTVSSTITMNASASDNVGVTRVDFYCDGSMLLGSATSAPYTLQCDTTRMPNGTRTLHCQAFDAAGNSANSANVSVTVNNTVVSSGPWAKRLGGTGNDAPGAVAVDAAGNVYLAGYFNGTVDFGGSPVTSAGDADIFVAKYSSSGVHVWSKRFGGTGLDNATAIALDASGNIFVAGSFAGGSLMKLSSQGDLLWTKGPACGFASVAVDSQGNVIATGSFIASYAAPMDFGNGITLYSVLNSADAFLVKYSSSGTCLWAKSFVNTGDKEYGTAVAVDKRVNTSTGLPYDTILLAGWSFYDINLGGANFHNGTWGAFGFVGKFTPAGDHVWSRTVGLKTLTDPTTAWTRIASIAVDSNGDAVLSGTFNVQADLGGGTVSSSAIDRSAYVAKYAGGDGRYVWSRAIVGDKACWPYGMVADAQNNIIITGCYYGTYAFGSQTLSNPSNTQIWDCFVAKYSSTGNPVWARDFGGASSDAGCAISVDPSGSPVATGYFQDSGTFGSQTLTSAGLLDCFLMKIDP